MTWAQADVTTSTSKLRVSATRAKTSRERYERIIGQLLGDRESGHDMTGPYNEKELAERPELRVTDWAWKSRMRLLLRYF